MDSVIRDIDKAFESFSKKVQDKFRKEEPIESLRSEEISTKFYRIIKFGGLMTIDDYKEEIQNNLEREDVLSMLFGTAIQWYLDMCGVRLPFSLKIYQPYSTYSLYKLLHNEDEFLSSMNMSQRFGEFLIQDARANGIIVDSSNYGIPVIDNDKLFAYLEEEDELFVLLEPNETYYSRESGNEFNRQHSMLGDFFFKYNVDEDIDESLERFSISFCKYLEDNFKTYYSQFKEKIEKLFGALSTSDNPECVRAMNESFIDKIKDKFAFDIGSDRLKNIDPLYKTIEDHIQRLYDMKMEELGFMESDRDLVSGLMASNKFLKDISRFVMWNAEVLPASKSDPVYFDNSRNYRIARSNSFIEEKFISKIAYGRLKRKYRMAKNGNPGNSDLYYATINPIFPRMSNREKFKIGFVIFEGPAKLDFKNAVDLCYNVVSYMRDNLEQDEWNNIEEQLNK